MSWQVTLDVTNGSSWILLQYYLSLESETLGKWSGDRSRVPHFQFHKHNSFVSFWPKHWICVKPTWGSKMMPHDVRASDKKRKHHSVGGICLVFPLLKVGEVWRTRWAAPPQQIKAPRSQAVATTGREGGMFTPDRWPVSAPRGCITADSQEKGVWVVGGGLWGTGSGRGVRMV